MTEYRGWLAQMLSEPSRPVARMSDKDKKTARYRIIARARDRDRGNAGQHEEQHQRIMDDTHKFYQDAADYHKMPIRGLGKTFYPSGS